VRLRSLDVPEELEKEAGDVPWVRWGVGFDVHAAWRDDDSGALAIRRTRPPYGTTLAMIGDPAGAVALAVELVERPEAELRGVRSMTLPRDAVPPPGPVFGPEPSGERWEWMWTPSAPPPRRGEERVAELDLSSPDMREAVGAFLGAHSPRHSAEPLDERVRRWLGVRDGDGALLATVALYEAVPGVDLMASVADAAQARGQGLGAAVAAAATRVALAERPPVATVDLYSDNDAARKLYARLGYRLDQAFTSYPLPSSVLLS
jgi:GNAT superfamily N-acetyltransferase